MCPLQLSLRAATVHIKVRIGSLEYFVICQKCTKECPQKKKAGVAIKNNKKTKKI